MAQGIQQGVHKVFSQKRWMGISDYLKEGANGQIPDQYYFGKCVNYRDDPQSLTLLPRGIRESGNVVTDLIKWADITPSNLDTYYYGNQGNFYKRSPQGLWEKLRTIANSHGNGIAFFNGDDYLYYALDTTIGRYGPISGTPQFADDFLKTAGAQLTSTNVQGQTQTLTSTIQVATNIGSLILNASQSQYAVAKNSSSLSIMGDLTLESSFKLASVPTPGNSMTILSKWDESSNNARSYKMGLFSTPNLSGQDGVFHITQDTQDNPIDAPANAASGSQTINAINDNFANKIGYPILIIQMQGSNPGSYEIQTLQSYSNGQVSTTSPLRNNYTTSGNSKAQLIVIPQYTDIILDQGTTWFAKPWDGNLGGVLVWGASGTVTLNGHISTDGCGYRGGNHIDWILNTPQAGNCGEGEEQSGNQKTSSAVDEGGGGANWISGNGPNGGNAGHATIGTTGSQSSNQTDAGSGGLKGIDNPSLSIMLMGGGGGSGGNKGEGPNSNGPQTYGGFGGRGGGIVFGVANTLIINPTTGLISVNGTAGENGLSNIGTGGGGGAAGSVLIRAFNVNVANNRIQAVGGAEGQTMDGKTSGNTGAVGRIHVDYATSFNGITNPTVNTSKNPNLSITLSNSGGKLQAQLFLSDDGIHGELATFDITTVSLGVWNRISMTWEAATHLYTLYLNAAQISSARGNISAINVNGSSLYVGCDKGSTLQNFYDGLLDDMRIWSSRQTVDQLYTNLNIELQGSEQNLVACYKFNDDFTDATANKNNLTWLG